MLVPFVIAIVGSSALTAPTARQARLIARDVAADYHRAEDEPLLSSMQVQLNASCRIIRAAVSASTRWSPGLACRLIVYSMMLAQGRLESSAASVSGRSLLQIGEPLDTFDEQLQQCRQLRGADE